MNGIRVLLDGSEVSSDGLAYLAAVNYGHFTAMQIRDGKVRSPAQHLERLRTAHAELYGTSIDVGNVQEQIRLAVAQAPDSYLRVTLFEPTPGRVMVMIALRPPVDAPTGPQSLLPVSYQRPMAHIKHVGSFAQVHFGQLAGAQGFSDALLTTDTGEVSETSIANIGFIRQDSAVIWPSAPALYGITRQALDTAFAARGVTVLRQKVTLGDLSEFTGSFTANSTGVSAVGSIGTYGFPDVDSAERILAVHDSLPWESF
ncbi:aminotransferase class IV [Micrococcaceae bacterium Sec5.7]